MLPGDDDPPVRVLQIPDHEFSDSRLRSAYLRAVALAERFGETAAFLVMAEAEPDRLAKGFAARLVDEVDLAATKLEKHDSIGDARALAIARAVLDAAEPDIAEVEALQSFRDIQRAFREPNQHAPQPPRRRWDPAVVREIQENALRGLERSWDLKIDASDFEAAVETWRTGRNDVARFTAIAKLVPGWSLRPGDYAAALLRKWKRHRRAHRPRGRPRKDTR